MERKLASIQKIQELVPIEGADKIELAKILGYVVIVQKGDFKEGDFCVYVEADSLLPTDNPRFAFLKNSKGKIERIKTIRMRGVYSQGIAFPLDILHDAESSTEYCVITNSICVFDKETGSCKGSLGEGSNVTDLLKITKYDPPEVDGLKQGDILGPFPIFIPKSDEPSVQSFPELLEELWNKPYMMTIKEDGTSATFYRKDGYIGVCSHKKEQKPGNNIYSSMMDKYGLSQILTDSKTDIAIQGEIVGPGVQKNRMRLKELEFHIYDVFDIATNKYYNWEMLMTFLQTFPQLISVRPYMTGSSFNYSIEQLINFSTQVAYQNNNPAEGLVIRPLTTVKSPTRRGERLSFKVLNPAYLAKN